MQHAQNIFMRDNNLFNVEVLVGDVTVLHFNCYQCHNKSITNASAKNGKCLVVVHLHKNQV